jgi:hypothetical protein
MKRTAIVQERASPAAMARAAARLYDAAALSSK